ncbi:hypothetical protein C8R45DRAFT_1133382 [Mycena sanguinolenta]|nr:hypothetical protein C8R45DRAFT_1133382 [Mycena sanguinolenta]
MSVLGKCCNICFTFRRGKEFMAQEVPDFPEENLWLLPSCVHGFNLTKKTWSTFKVTENEPVSFDHDAWDHLVLNPETKHVDVEKKHNAILILLLSRLSWVEGWTSLLIHEHCDIP